MSEPERTEWQIRCAFNGFCKRVLKYEAINHYRDTQRRLKHEVSFSDLAPNEEKQLYTVDRYFENGDKDGYCIKGLKITSKMLAERKAAGRADVLLSRQIRCGDRGRTEHSAQYGAISTDKLF